MKFLEEHKKSALLITSLICIITIFLTLGDNRPTFVVNAVGYVVVPQQNVVTNTTGWISERIYFFNNAHEIELENIELRAKVDHLSAEYIRMELLERDNIHLRELLQLDQRYPNFSTIGAEIIARDSNNWNTSFIIDKGTSHGLDANMVVIAHGGLVGRIVHSGSNFSRVMPIIDDSSSVGATTLRTGDFGFVRGDLMFSTTGLLSMELLDLDSEILVGDEIITSALGRIYPNGISIGTVVDVQDNPATLTRVASILPTVDFRRLSTVLVIYEIFDVDFEDSGF